MSPIAALDIGTNTFRMLIASKGKKGDIVPLMKARKIVCLGEGYQSSSKISEQATKRGIKVLKEFIGLMHDKKVGVCSAIATGVVRSALNSSKFLEKVEKECNLPVKVINGEEEALLTLKGVELAFTEPKTGDSCLIFDIGGGSTEIIYCDNGILKIIESIDLGVVTLAELMENDPPPREELEAIMQKTERVFAPVAERIRIQLKNRRPFVIGTAGTVTTLAAMKQELLDYQQEKINGFILESNYIHNIFSHLIKLKEKTREKIPGLEKGRGRIIIPGCLILLTIMNLFEIERISVSDFGLLEGIVREIFDSLDTPGDLV